MLLPFRGRRRRPVLMRNPRYRRSTTLFAWSTTPSRSKGAEPVQSRRAECSTSARKPARARCWPDTDANTVPRRSEVPLSKAAWAAVASGDLLPRRTMAPAPIRSSTAGLRRRRAFAARNHGDRAPDAAGVFRHGSAVAQAAGQRRCPTRGERERRAVRGRQDQASSGGDVEQPGGRQGVLACGSARAREQRAARLRIVPRGVVVETVGKHCGAVGRGDVDAGRERQHVDDDDHVADRGQGLHPAQAPLTADVELALIQMRCAPHAVSRASARRAGPRDGAWGPGRPARRRR